MTRTALVLLAAGLLPVPAQARDTPRDRWFYAPSTSRSRRTPTSWSA
jgi:hypothetical protein